MSKLTIDLGILSDEEQKAAESLVIASALAKAKADFNASLAKSKEELKIKAQAEAFAKSDEGLAKAEAEAKEAERLNNFREKLFDVESNYDCYVINGQLGKEKLYRVFSTVSAAKKFAEDLKAIGGRVYTHEPVSCKIK